jgi:hypothetical protein
MFIDNPGLVQEPRDISPGSEVNKRGCFPDQTDAGQGKKGVTQGPIMMYENLSLRSHSH